MVSGTTFLHQCYPTLSYMLLSPGQRGVAPADCRNPFSLVKTEVNGDSMSTNERGPALFGSLGSSCPYKRLLSFLGCSGQPSTKKFFLTVHYSISIYVSPSPSNLFGSRAGPLVLIENYQTYILWPDKKNYRTFSFRSSTAHAPAKIDKLSDHKK
jgi:hypothetical protein